MFRTLGDLTIAALLLPIGVGSLAHSRAPVTFDIASVRASTRGGFPSIVITPTRVSITNTPLLLLVSMAFNVEWFQIQGPDWPRGLRFDIQATLAPGTSREQIPEMLRALLEQRFGLETHIESRPMPVYALHVGSDGIKMKEVSAVDDLLTTFPQDDGLDVAGRTAGQVGDHPGQGARPEFDVVSIRNRVTPTGSIRTVLGNGVFDRPNITLDALILFAYDLDPYQLLNSPSWAGTERFDVSARGSEAATVPVIRLMMRRVLEDRFQLLAHRDIREMDTYVLTLAEPGSGPPSGLKRNADNCETLVVAPPGTPQGAATVVGCDTAEGIARFLSKLLGRQVENRTGLSGNFEYSFYYAPIEGGLAPGATTGDVPSIESALPEQLGLRLIASRAPVAVVVVDSVDHPSEN